MIKSASQFRLMEAAKSGNLRGVGPSPEVASEFLSKTPHSVKSRFAHALRKKKRK